MADCLGVNAAGGIGFERMGRFERGEYGSACTVLLVFLAVPLREQATQALLKNLM